jgi:hypothetical protein
MVTSSVWRRLLEQHPDLDITQVDAEGLVPSARQLDEFAQLGGWTELCRVQGIRIGHRKMVRRDVRLHAAP